MKIAILANRANSFVLPMAEGLQRMLFQIGVDSKIFYCGLQAIFRPSLFKHDIKDRIRQIIRKTRFFSLIPQLRGFNVIVVVSHIPTPFKNNLAIETLRRFLPSIPIVLYDLKYLPTCGLWWKGLRQRNEWGLERYDWYLCVSVVTEFPVPKGQQPYSLIGVNLNDGSLKPQAKKEFIALIDFERPSNMQERAIQILACEETKTKYIVLSGRYSIAEIRAIYRRCSIYFVAHRESFGLPIGELQACGAYIFTPYSSWCPAHWIKKDLSLWGPGEFSCNFIVYGNNKDIVVREINRIKAIYDPQVVSNFQKNYPGYFFGNLGELKKFVQMVEKGEIHSKLHKDHIHITWPEYKYYHDPQEDDTFFGE